MPETPEPKVVSLRGLKTRANHLSPNAVYIGRTFAGWQDQGWGNPIRLSPQISREDAIQLYRVWLELHPEVIERAVQELKGKTLVCWCAPEACHGDVLLEIASR